MSETTTHFYRTHPEQWLKHYYFMRTLFSVLWVVTAFAIGQHSLALAAAMLVIYPAWDALANYVDATFSGGLGRNRMQALNIVVSIITTLAVIVALRISANAVIAVFGVWAIISGLLQLGAALRRWKRFGAQWTMILSGAQSALAGGFFIFQAKMPVPPSILNIAGYAAVGALYFFISAVWLTVSLRKKHAI